MEETDSARQGWTITFCYLSLQLFAQSQHWRTWLSSLTSGLSLAVIDFKLRFHLGNSSVSIAFRWRKGQKKSPRRPVKHNQNSCQLCKRKSFPLGCFFLPPVVIGKERSLSNYSPSLRLSSFQVFLFFLIWFNLVESQNSSFETFDFHWEWRGIRENQTLFNAMQSLTLFYFLLLSLFVSQWKGQINPQKKRDWALMYLSFLMPIKKSHRGLCHVKGCCLCM